MAFGTRAPSTITVINLSGQKDFTIPFEYLARKFVVVTLLGKDRLLLTLNKDYRFTSKTNINVTISIDSAKYNQIEIRRVTSANERLVDFHDGSILRANDLNIAQIQTLHVAEEARDLASDSIGVNDEGHLDARNRKIINLADGTNPRDAVNLGQLQAYDNSTLNNANKAQASANAAKVSEDEAKKWANAAKTSETNAKASETNAKTSETNAKNSENAAKTSETNAKTSETNAKNSEANAKNSQNAAKTHEDNAKAHADRADSAKNVVVDALEATGNVPVGTIAMVAHNVSTPPAGWLFCGTSFNTSAYPALARLFPNGQIPSFENRFPIGAGSVTGVGAHGNQAYPAHTHSVSVSGNVSTLAQAVYNTTSTGAYNGSVSSQAAFTSSSAGAHSHTYRSTMSSTSTSTTYASTNAQAKLGNVNTSEAGAHTHTIPAHGHTFSIPNHAHQVTIPAHNHSFSYSGNSGSTGSGDRVLPYNIGVKYIIKAYEGVVDKDEALVVVGKIDARVAALESGKAPAGYGLGEHPRNVNADNERLGGFWRDTSTGLAGVTLPYDSTPTTRAIGVTVHGGVRAASRSGGGFTWRKIYSEVDKPATSDVAGLQDALDNKAPAGYGVGTTGTGFTTASGFIATSGVAAGFPSNGAGFQSTYGSTRRAQFFISASSGRVYSRFSMSNSSVDTSTEWAEHYTTIYPPTAFDVKAQPLIVNPDVLLETTNYLTASTTYRYRDVDYLSKLRVHVGSIPKFTTLEETNEDGTTTLEEVHDGEEITLDTQGAVLELFKIVHDLQARIRELEAKQ